MRSSLFSALFAAAAFAAPLESALENISETASSAAAECKPIILIYARGTWEPGTPPNQVAAPLIKALNAKYPGKIEFQNVQYNGGASGYLGGGDTAGTKKMEEMAKTAVQKCPNSGLLMVGYSQGAQLLHNAVSNLPPNVSQRIRAVVVFGDPYKGKAIRGIPPQIILTECYPNDNVCNGLPLPVGAHNEYDKRVPSVTDWLVHMLGPL